MRHAVKLMLSAMGAKQGPPPHGHTCHSLSLDIENPPSHLESCGSFRSAPLRPQSMLQSRGRNGTGGPQGARVSPEAVPFSAGRCCFSLNLPWNTALLLACSTNPGGQTSPSSSALSTRLPPQPQDLGTATAPKTTMSVWNEARRGPISSVIPETGADFILLCG